MGAVLHRPALGEGIPRSGLRFTSALRSWRPIGCGVFYAFPPWLTQSAQRTALVEGVSRCFVRDRSELTGTMAVG